MHSSRIAEIEVRLDAIEAERKALAEELVRLRANGFLLKEQLPKTGGGPCVVPQTSTEKVALFLKLFCARESVFPRLWENSRTGRKGYAPACRNEWTRGVCGKPKVKCSECPHQAFPPPNA